MTVRIRFAYQVLSAGVTAGALAAGIALGVAAVGWLVGSQTLAGALAMIASWFLITGFGGIHLSWWALGIVGLSWAFADDLLFRIGMPGPVYLLTMAATYLTLGMTKGRPPQPGVLPVLGLIVGVALAAALFPRQVADGVTEAAVLTASMVSAARSVCLYVAFMKERRLLIFAERSA